MDRYEKVHILGRGSFGTAILVRVASGLGAGTLRVVKEVELNGVDDKRRTDALHEAEVLKSLSHPHIVTYHEAVLVERCLCIVMEYADGGDLAGAISRHRTDGRRYHEREAMAVFGQLALALEYVHGRRILHRDLKSQNVFLTSAGIAMLGDFGIARVLEASECCAETKIGTPQQLPPEMCENNPYDFKADVWGLGVLLYEMLTLELPFNAGSFAALVLKICTAEPRPIPAVYSTEVRLLLGRMLAKRPDERPSCAEVAALPHVRRGIAGSSSAVTRPAGGSARAPESAIESMKALPVGVLGLSNSDLFFPSECDNSASIAWPVQSPKRVADSLTFHIALTAIDAQAGDDRCDIAESPKRMRKLAPAPLSSIFSREVADRGVPKSIVEVASPQTRGVEAVTSLQRAGACWVSAAELAEAERDFGLDTSPVKTRAAAKIPWSPFLSRSDSPSLPDRTRLNYNSKALEMSVSCSNLLRELEKELNLS